MTLRDMTIRVVLVPAGAEYRAVKRGLKRVEKQPQVVAIPAGPQAAKRFLEEWVRTSLLPGSEVLLMGLGGSLSAQYGISSVLVMGRVWNACERQENLSHLCDSKLSAKIAERLGTEIGVGVTCDRVITTVKEKKALCDRYQAQVVDMESFALLKVLSHHRANHRNNHTANHSVTILRVISDSCFHDLPDISEALAPNGSLKTMTLLSNFSKQPVAALRLIYGSLKGLKALEQVAYKLFL